MTRPQPIEFQHIYIYLVCKIKLLCVLLSDGKKEIQNLEEDFMALGSLLRPLAWDTLRLGK